MITFSKNSWHYKFNKFFKYKDAPFIDNTDCKSICPYFWGTVWNLAWVVIFSSLVWVILTLAGGGVVKQLGILTSLVENPYQLFWLWLLGAIPVVIVVGTLFSAVLCVSYSYTFIKDKTSKVFSKNNEESYNTEPNILIEWVKAKKAKICPMIEFKE